MTSLRQRMIEDMRIRNFSEHTIGGYVRYVARFARHFGRSPQHLGQEHVRGFLAHLVEHENAKHGTLTQVVSALRFLYSITLESDWVLDKIARPRRARPLPVVLSRDEVARLLCALTNVKHRALLTTGYATGLRASEVTNLRIEDIDSSRMVIHVREGKGKKDRYVPLSPRLLELLREYWRAFRPRTYLFPGRPDRGKPMARRNPHRIAVNAAKAAGVNKRIGFHTLRHCFATHLLDAGVNVRMIQLLLGHRALSSTAKYSHIATSGLLAIKSPLDLPSD